MRSRHVVYGGSSEHGVECDVRLDQHLLSLGLRHALEPASQLLPALIVDASCGERSGRGLQDAAHLVEVEFAIAEQQMADEPGALQEQVGLEAAHVRAIALPDLEHAQL